jgi:hypothetical protein
MKRHIVMAAGAAVLMGSVHPEQPRIDEHVQFLEPLIGDWTVAFPDSVLQANHSLRDMVTHRYEWTVGDMAILMFGNVPGGRSADGRPQGGLPLRATREILVWRF